MSRKSKTEMSDQEKAERVVARNQDKRDRFCRLAANRVEKALKALRMVARLGNKQGYTYTEEEAEEIRIALNAQVTRTTDAFLGVREVQRAFSFTNGIPRS